MRGQGCAKMYKRKEVFKDRNLSMCEPKELVTTVGHLETTGANTSTFTCKFFVHLHVEIV